MNKLHTICFILPLLISLVGCSKQIIPVIDKHSIISAYTDATGDNGNSIIKCEQKNGIRFDYILKPGFEYPYAGISIYPDSGLLDLHGYRYIDITLSADTVCAVNIYLKTVQDSYTIPDNYITYRFLEYTLWINTVPQVYRINISSMTTPEWWYTVNKKVPGQLGRPNLRKVKNYDIATKSTYLQRSGFIHVHKMVLIKDNVSSFIGCCILLLIALFAGIILLIIKRYRKQKIISYQQVNNQSLQSSEEERIATFIGSNYADSSLSIEIVGRETGVHWSRVSSIIKKNHNLTFKQYLNTIRIAEAKRLLSKTDRQIIDIALSVGYGNISHFNRVFKEFENCSPREFRSKYTKQNINSDIKN